MTNVSQTPCKCPRWKDIPKVYSVEQTPGRGCWRHEVPCLQGWFWGSIPQILGTFSQIQLGFFKVSYVHQSTGITLLHGEFEIALKNSIRIHGVENKPCPIMCEQNLNSSVGLRKLPCRPSGERRLRSRCSTGSPSSQDTGSLALDLSGDQELPCPHTLPSCAGNRVAAPCPSCCGWARHPGLRRAQFCFFFICLHSAQFRCTA